jgi:hypothetical protein
MDLDNKMGAMYFRLPLYVSSGKFQSMNSLQNGPVRLRTTKLILKKAPITGKIRR